MTHLYAARAAALLLSLACALTAALGQGDDACIMSATRCQCAPATQSGTCTRSSGDGTCLLGACGPGYRCDCFGFEVCNVAKCGKFVPVGAAQPSMSVPFRCELVPESRQCTAFAGLLDTAAAACHAETSAATSNDEMTAAELAITTIVQSLLGSKQVVNQLLRDVEQVADDVPVAELDAINEEAGKITDAVTEVTDLVGEVVVLGRRMSALLNETREFKRAAVEKDVATRAKAQELATAQTAATTAGTPCAGCAALQAEIDALVAARKAAALAAGAKAQEMRDVLRQASDKVKEAERVKERVTALVRSVNAKVESSLGKVSGRVLPATS